MRRAAFGLALALVVAGCGGRQWAAVEGVVTLDGRPLADVEVQFIPDVTQGATGPPASAYTDKDGRYRIAATDKGGVVVGKHRVRVNDATVMVPGGGADAESGAAGPVGAPKPPRNRVPAPYSDAARSPLGAVEVRPGTQTHDLDLKSKP